MTRTQIYLTETEQRGLRELAQTTKHSQSALIREAIDQYLTRQMPQDKLVKIRRAKGMWKNRTDFDPAAIRTEFDRF